MRSRNQEVERDQSRKQRKAGSAAVPWDNCHHARARRCRSRPLSADRRARAAFCPGAPRCDARHLAATRHKEEPEPGLVRDRASRHRGPVYVHASGSARFDLGVMAPGGRCPGARPAPYRGRDRRLHHPAPDLERARYGPAAGPSRRTGRARAGGPSWLVERHPSARIEDARGDRTALLER